VLALDDGRWRTEFDTPQWAPTPGQYLVLYEGDVCLGGGSITSVARDAEVVAPPRIGAVIPA
jgi:tRNA-specific 2-thiouridylase